MQHGKGVAMSEVRTEVLAVDDIQALPRAESVLRAGGVVAFPTDTVYGLGALYTNRAAVLKLYSAKERPGEKAIPILVDSLESAEKVSSGIDPATRKLAAAFWPGPLTLLVPRHPGVPVEVSAYATAAVRVPDLAFTRSLLACCGPLAVTSANLSGGASPCTAGEVLVDLAGRVDLVLDGGRTPGGRSSTVVDCTGEHPILLREGPISLEEILAALG